MQVSSSQADALFSATITQQSQLDSIAASTLSRGVDAFTNGDMDTAITNFKRSIALSPYSDNAMKAFQLLANAYKQQGKTDEIIKTWQQAANLFPQSDIPHSGLGDVYFSQQNYSAAEKEYALAVRLNPTESSNYYSLGQAYMAEGRYTDAEAQFKKVIQIKPQDPSGYYSLGQDYHKMGNYDDAVTQLQKAIDVNKNFTDARLELGMTYTDMKQTDKAGEQAYLLSQSDQSKSVQLQNYMTDAAAPKITAVYSLSAFNTLLGAGTPVSAVSPDLVSAGSSKTFSMSFVFSKDMDADSVQNISNWLIAKSSYADPGGAYNWGLPTNSTDTSVAPLPIGVVYHSDTLTADITFRVAQNSSGTATLDTSHLMFKFSGLDAYGNAMDQSADQYSGISKIV